MASDFAVFSLPIAHEGHLTAKLSLALRAARGKIRCPSEAYVRAVNLCGGEPVAWSARLPSNPPPHTYCIRVRIIHPFCRLTATLRSPQYETIRLTYVIRYPVSGLFSRFPGAGHSKNDFCYLLIL